MAARSCAWYDASKEELADKVVEQLDYTRRQQETMRLNWLEYLEAYAAGDVTGLGRDRATSRYYAIDAEEGPEVRFNLTSAMVDTACSLISQAPAVPQYLTVDGDFKLTRKAEKASQILQGQFSNEVKEICKRAWLDAAKLGTGFVFEKFDPITGLPGIRRESPFSVYVEYLDGMEMCPRSVHVSRLVPKELLAGQFPDLAQVIEDAPAILKTRITDLLLPGIDATFAYTDFIEVVESWHLRPSAKGKGRHTIIIPGAVLLDEKWLRDELPMAVFRYRERDTGFYGAGLAESCRAAQNRIDQLIKRVGRGQDLGSNLIILNPNGEGAVSQEKLTNEMGLVINYLPAIGPPQLVKWEGTLDDLQRQIDLEVARAMMVEGISESQANGQGAGKGLDSGVAVRAADDVQSRRLVPFVTRYQNSCMAVARLFESMNDTCAKKDKKYRPQVEGQGPMRTFLVTSNWAEIRPPKGDARLMMAAMSALPTAPAARWAAVQDWIAAGFASRQYAMSLLQFPDLDAYASTELAHLELARWQIEKLLDGEMPLADPRQDLDLAIDLVTKSKFQVVIRGGNDEEVQLFEDFIVELEYLQDLAVQQEMEAQAAAAPPAPPPAPGMDPATGLPTGVLAPGLTQAAPALGMVG